MKHDEIKIPHDHGQDYEKLLEQMLIQIQSNPFLIY